jgi:regulatory protein SWI6
MIQSLSSDFSLEIKSKQDSLDVTQAHLRAATRELSEQRKQIQAWQSRCAELDQINQRVRNIEKALTDEDQFDWTGRTGKDAGPAFAYRGSGSTMVGLGGGVDISFNVDPEPPMPVGCEVKDLVRLRRMKMWYERIDELVKGRLGGLKGASAEKEFMCKKIVALCTGIPVDKVEDVSLMAVLG